MDEYGFLTLEEIEDLTTEEIKELRMKLFEEYLFRLGVGSHEMMELNNWRPFEHLSAEALDEGVSLFKGNK